MSKFPLSFVASLVFFLLFNICDSTCQTDDKGLFVKVQANEFEGVIVEYSGYITEGTDRDFLYLTTRALKVISIPFSSILTIQTKRGKDAMRKNEIERIEEEYFEEDEYVYNFREKGLYAVLGTEFNFKSDNGFDLHPGIDLTLGYKFNRMLAVGIGGSIRSWTYDIRPSAVANIYAEARGWFLEKGASPYYRIKLGYGNAWGDSQGEFGRNYQSSTGGLHYAAAIGVRLINSRVMNLNLETGLNHQGITYHDLSFGAFQRKYSFNRHYIGISMMY